MMRLNSRLSIGTLYNIATGAVFIIAAAVIVLLVNTSMKREALRDAEEKARLLLDRNLATHHYFSHTMKSSLFKWTTPLITKDYFDPTWMSSTFAVREIDKNFKTLSPSDYYYKECAINARSPENEADTYEKEFIMRLNAEPALEVGSEVRELGGKPYFVIMRRGEVMEAGCLRCHDTPSIAPAGLVALYGAERSFGRHVNDVVSAISIRIPLAAAYAHANRVTLQLSLVLSLLLVGLFAVQFWLSKRLLFTPLHAMREKAVQISTDTNHLGEEIPLPLGRELHDLSDAFNTMSVSLRQSKDNLESIVEQRTEELRTTNEQLRKALSEVKTLGGMLPICSSCKKIRDDKGYWSKIEAYISEHSDAEFTHSICPDCAQKLYPKYYKKGPD